MTTNVVIGATSNELWNAFAEHHFLIAMENRLRQTVSSIYPRHVKTCVCPSYNKLDTLSCGSRYDNTLIN